MAGPTPGFMLNLFGRGEARAVGRGGTRAWACRYSPGRLPSPARNGADSGPVRPQPQHSSLGLYVAETLMSLTNAAPKPAVTWRDAAGRVVADSTYRFDMPRRREHRGGPTPSDLRTAADALLATDPGDDRSAVFEGGVRPSVRP